MKKETTLKDNQYGGRKGSSCEHYVIDLLTKIHESLDQKETACNLIAIDFKKAFNTLDHSACLERLRQSGASTFTLSMVRSFLANRQMRAKIGRTLSDSRRIKGGSPQGTLLGNLLFTIATDEIEDGKTTEPNTATNPNAHIQSETYEDIGHCVSTPAGIERTLSGLSEISGLDGEPLRLCERTLRYDMSDSESDEDRSLQHTFWINEHPPPNHWSPRPLTTVKFIDDITAASKSYLPASYEIFSQNKPERIIHAKECQDFYNRVVNNGKILGLHVNPKKTQLVCVTSAIGSTPTAYIELPTGERIKSQESLKVLGFHIGSTPGMAEQVKHLQKCYRGRAWIIRNLKRAGLSKKDLVDMYKTLVRPVLDYMAPVYHPMLSLDQRKIIERLQMRTLKTIYGYDKSLSLIHI